MSVTGQHKGIWIASLIWLICLAAALFAAGLRDANISQLMPFALIGAVPAVLSVMLSPFLRREWAQIIVIFSWLALAILACLAIAFMPMAFLFLCAPAMAALFEREKVIEAMVLAAICAAGLFYVGNMGFQLNTPFADALPGDWGAKTGIAATIGLLVAALYGVAATETPLSYDNSSDGIFEAIPGGVVRVTSDNKVASASSAAVEILQLPANDTALDVLDMMVVDQQSENLLHMIEQSRQKGEAVKQKFRLLQPSGISRMAEITATPSETGEVLIHIHDSTAHEARVNSLHEAFASAQKDSDSKSLFFAGVSHELRTPLNAIIGFSDMMRSRLFGPLPNKYAEYAELIHDSGQHMLDLIGDVLDLSKVDAGKYELVYDRFDVADVIRSSVKMLRPAADSAEVQLDVEVRGDAGELLVNADRKALRQIILNLLSNAIKFTPKGGRVLVRGQIEDDRLNVSVIDNGSGMSAAELKTVGTPYTQTESGKNNAARGSGLGLSLVKSLAELHNGQFDLTSEKGIGTTADISIPAQR